jgi:serine/threonine protein kinase
VGALIHLLNIDS